jgi:hypothetical protein
MSSSEISRIDLKSSKGAAQASYSAHSAHSATSKPKANKPRFDIPRILINGEEIPSNAAETDKRWYGGGAVERDFWRWEGRSSAK